MIKATNDHALVKGFQTEGNIGYDRITKMLDVRDNHIVVEQQGRFTIEQLLMKKGCRTGRSTCIKLSVARSIS